MTHDDSPFFLRPFNPNPLLEPAEDCWWFYKSRVGQNLISNILKGMIKDSGIEVGNRKLTNRSVRKRLATSMSKNGESTAAMMRQLGHSNASSLSNYDTPDDSTTDRVTKLLYGMPSSNPSLSSNSPGPSHHQTTAPAPPQQTSVEARGVKRSAIDTTTDQPGKIQVLSDQNSLNSIFQTAGAMSIGTVNVYNQYSHGQNP